MEGGGGWGEGVVDWIGRPPDSLHSPSAVRSLAAEASALIFCGAWRPNAIYVGLKQQTVSVNAHISYGVEGCGGEGPCR